MKQLSYSYKAIIKIALPLMISNFFYVMIAFADVAFMKKVGVTELAAIGYIALVYLFFFMIGFSYTKGTQILIARKVGEERPKAIGIIVDNTVVVLLSIATVLFLVLAFFGKDMLSWALLDQEVVEASYAYLSIRKWGFFLSFLGSIMIAYYSGIEKTMVLAVAIISMSISNIALNWILIFGKFGAPELGIRGAAYASNIAETISIVILIAGVFIYNLRKKHHLFFFRRISTNIIKRISALSSPLVVQTVVGLGAWLVFFTLIEKMGKESLAISNVVKQLYTVLGIPAFALASTTNTVIGNIVGQRKVKEVIPLLMRIIWVSLGFILLLSLPAILFPKFFLGILLPNETLMNQSIMPLYVALIALQFYGFSTVLFNCIASIGSTMVSMIVEIITIVVYLVFCYFLFYVWESDLTLVWTTEWLYWLCIAVLSAAYLRFSNWREHI